MKTLTIFLTQKKKKLEKFPRTVAEMKMEHPEYTVRQMSSRVKAKREEKSRSAEVNGFLEMFPRVRERKRERERA